MKKIILAFFLAVALSGPGRAGVFTFIDGSLFTNATVSVGGVTLQNGVVLPSSTNYYNLTNQAGAQPNTNQWPCSILTPQGTYSSSASYLIVPYPAFVPASSNFTFFCSFSNTLGTAQSASFSFAASLDGILWVSNYLTLTESTGNSSFSTNVGAINFVGLSSVANTNPAAALTNISLKVGFKPGL